MLPKLCLINCVLFSINSSLQKTEITKWKDDKKAAISLTSTMDRPTSFSVALPMLINLTYRYVFYYHRRCWRF
jgi:hypothetical protein